VSFSAGLLPLVVDLASRALRALRAPWHLRVRLFQILLLGVVQTLPAHATGGVILVLGDSLSSAYGIDVAAGWVQLLQNRLDKENAAYRVVNASISGDTSNGGAARLASALQKHAPDVVVVELGGNDGLRGLPLSVTRANLERIVVDAQTAGARVLLLGIRLPPNYGPAYNDAFHAIYEQLASRYQVGRVPFLLDGVGGVDGMMQADGLHPRAEAQATILDNVWPHLQPLL
jgi:acyl-CoA thioesterase-1